VQLSCARNRQAASKKIPVKNYFGSEVLPKMIFKMFKTREN
jgi:hypothetical protein